MGLGDVMTTRMCAAVAVCCAAVCGAPLAGCDSADEAAQAPPADPPAEARRPEARPYERVDLTLRRAVDTDGLDALLAPLLRGAGTVELAAGVDLSVALDPATDSLRVVTVRLAASTGGEADRLLRVPMSAAYLDLFAEASAQGLMATDGQAAPSPFEVTYEVISPNGGAVFMTVRPGRFEARLRSAATSLDPETLYAPLPDGDAHEVVSAQIRYGMDYLTLRQLLLTAFDPESLGGTDDLCGELNDYAVNAPHVWYDMCIRADNVELPVSVDVDLLTRDGRRLPIARSPGGLRTAMLWISGLDRVAAALSADTGVEVPASAFDYRDPEVQGGAIFTASAEDGQVVFDHRSITPPSTLPDLAPVTRPVPRPLAPAPDDPCADAGSVSAPAGTLVIDARLDAQLVEYVNLTPPVAGAVRASIYHAEDVSITGPSADAVALDTFAIEGVALGTEAPEGRHVSPTLPAGTYMVLGFFDVDGDADLADPQPIQGEPVTLPLRRIELRCAEQPFTMVFDAPFPG